MITLVCAMDMDNGIGDGDNNLLFHLPKDLKRFNSVTTGGIVVMGRKTWESLPKKPLQKRRNIVLTRDESYDVGEHAEIIRSIDEVLSLSANKEVFVIGGQEIYEQFLPHADKMILTHVHVLDGKAEVHFPNYNYEEWKIEPNSKKHLADSKHEHDFTFAVYNRHNKKETN